MWRHDRELPERLLRPELRRRIFGVQQWLRRQEQRSIALRLVHERVRRERDVREWSMLPVPARIGLHELPVSSVWDWLRSVLHLPEVDGEGLPQPIRQRLSLKRLAAL